LCSWKGDLAHIPIQLFFGFLSSFCDQNISEKFDLSLTCEVEKKAKVRKNFGKHANHGELKRERLK
jgi:hypothetical protein